MAAASLLNRLGLRSKIAVVVALGLIAQFLMSGLAWYTNVHINTIFQEYSVAVDNETKAELIVNKISQSASDLSSFILKPNDELLKNINNQFEDILKTIEKFDALTVILQSMKDGEIYQDLMKQLIQSEKQIIQSQQKIGFNENSGLVGDLRKSVHNIENFIEKVSKEKINTINFDEFKINMLSLRRHEKDYLLRGQKKYIDNFQKSISEFESRIRSSNFDENTKIELARNLENYNKNFLNLANEKTKISNLALDFHKVKEKILQLSIDIDNKFVSEKDQKSDAIKNNISLSNKINFISGLLICLFNILMAWFVARSITMPVRQIADGMKSIAKGNCDIVLPQLKTGDELETLCHAAEDYRNATLERETLNLAAEREQQRERQHQSELEVLIGDFRGIVTSSLTSLTNEMQGMQNTAQTLSDVANSAESETLSAHDASRQSSMNVQSVAAATEELAASIREIASQAQKASEKVGDANHAVQNTNRDVASLAEAAQKIGAVVDLIRDIAEQTNLLALNATIEAARAGEAGRGFAVVASEVKTLASQTAKATEEISGQIAEVQTSTHKAVEAIRSISFTIEEIEAMTTTIAAAVEEQDAATKEIAQSVDRVSEGSSRVSHSIQSVSGAIQETNRGATLVNHVATELITTSQELSIAVDNFLEGVAADVKDRRSKDRRKVNHDVIVRIGGQEKTTKMLDISETGARINALEGMETGRDVQLKMPDDTFRRARIVWVMNGACGLHFETIATMLKNRAA
jgi:methyl-accepting chemotaxis protein